MASQRITVFSHLFLLFFSCFKGAKSGDAETKVPAAEQVAQQSPHDRDRRSHGQQLEHQAHQAGLQYQFLLEQISIQDSVISMIRRLFAIYYIYFFHVMFINLRNYGNRETTSDVSFNGLFKF